MDVKQFLQALPEMASIAADRGVQWGKSYRMASTMGQGPEQWIVSQPEHARAAFAVFSEYTRQGGGTALPSDGLSEAVRDLETAVRTGVDIAGMRQALRMSLGLTEAAETMPADMPTPAPAEQPNELDSAMREKCASMMQDCRDMGVTVDHGPHGNELSLRGMSQVSANLVMAQLADRDLPVDLSGLTASDMAILHTYLMGKMNEQKMTNGESENE